MYSYERGQVWDCYDFARRMIGNHNPNMIMEREDWEIFRDDFRGKLGEVALKNYIAHLLPNAEFNENIDFTVTPRGQWDITDLVVNNQYISVKSVKGNSGFLMIEAFRFDEDGNYYYQNNNGEAVRVDIYALVRVLIEPEMTRDDMAYNSINEFWNAKQRVQYEVMGGIKHEDFWERKHFAPAGICCNRETLLAVCCGEEVRPAGNGGRTEILQQDNYILNGREELSPIRNLL